MCGSLHKVGENFFKEGVAEVDKVLIPMLQSQAREGISPRVIVSHAKLLWFAQEVMSPFDWFCMQILNTAGMSGSHRRLHDYLLDHVLQTASELQSWSNPQPG